MKVKELGPYELAAFYLKSTVKNDYSVIIFNPNVEPGSAEALSEIFEVKLTPSDEVELAIIKMDNLKKAQARCLQAAETFKHCAFEIWHKGRKLVDYKL